MAKRDPNKPKKQARPGQKAGYCIPPESGRIKSGEVRNPWGPKGKPKPMVEDPYETAMSQITKSNLNGSDAAITAELGIYLVHVQRALAGSTASFNALIKARPGRGQRIEANKQLEKQRGDAAENAQRQALAAELVNLLKRGMNQKKKDGEERALREGKTYWGDSDVGPSTDPETDPDA